MPGRPDVRATSQTGDSLRPLTVALTLGDPAGVGPEVALRAARALLRRRPGRFAGSASGRSTARLLLVGDRRSTVETVERLRLPIEVVDAGAARGRGNRLELPLVPPGDGRAPGPLGALERRPGKPSIAGARVAYESIRTAVRLARAGEVDAICTAPINKHWFDRARVASTGHTEILAALTRSPRVRLMMTTGSLRVVLATTHLAIRDVARALTVAGIHETIIVTAAHLEKWWGIVRPRVAVAALNPHASDGGVYGDEEARLIAPAIARARRSGIDALGPVPGDTLFSAVGPRADAVVAMYHDQGLIPVKQLDVHHAVNVTLGLPFVRTSPDHGTAYDLAGTGRADPTSMQSALELALRLAAIERRQALPKRTR